MLKQVPFILLYSRLAVAPVVLAIAYFQPVYYQEYLISIMIYGVVSDFFDGFIARRIGTSTEKLRKADSNVDQVFWLAIIAGLLYISPQFFKTYYIEIIILFSLEVLAYLISFIRFKKVVATHAIASKLWVLTLLATLIEVTLTGNSGFLFKLCFWVGLISRIEIVSIMLLLRKWTNDVPGIYQAIQLRKGKEIKRNKIFNG